VAGLAGVRALPGVAVTDARVFERSPAGPETDTGGVRIGVEVSADDHMAITAPLLHRHRGGHGLQLALALEVEPRPASGLRARRERPRRF
jgi:hypothetical protein